MNEKKNRYFVKISEFLCVCAFFVLPPLITIPSGESEIIMSVSYSRILFNILAIIVLYICANSFSVFVLNTKIQKYKKVSSVSVRNFFLRALCITLATLVALFICMILIEYSAFKFLSYPPSNSFFDTNNPIIVVILFIFFAAIYEEVLYRWYLPRTLKAIAALTLLQCGYLHKNVKDKKDILFLKLLWILAEIIPICCFAYAHRYLGIAAVANALCAGCILRIAVKKTATPFYTGVAHTIYNIVISFILL